MLRPYQLEAGEAVARSACRRDGKIFVVMMSRQSGKNELAAVLHAYLLYLWALEGGDIIVAAPSFKPQIVNSERRLHEVLDMPISHDLWEPHRGYYIELGKARLSFFSADRAANVVGATASILLSVDEAQDVDRDVYQRKFRPMASTTNATTVLFGTAWDEDNILEEQRRTNREIEKRTGERLNFEVPWTVLAGTNPTYKEFVEGEIGRLGIDHPTIRTQYMLEAATGAGRLFSEELLQRMRGTHERLVGPEEGKQYVAGVDIAGQVSEDGKMVLNQWDETVVTIAEVDRSGGTGDGLETRPSGHDGGVEDRTRASILTACRGALDTVTRPIGKARAVASPLTSPNMPCGARAGRSRRRDWGQVDGGCRWCGWSSTITGGG